MKKPLIILFLIMCSVASAKTYYVAPLTSSPAGNDFSVGDKDHPWLTWGKAFRTAQPGDTVFFRGGTYYTEVTDGQGIKYSPVDRLGYDGTALNPICYINYPGEIPVLDCSGSTATHDGVYNYGLFLYGVDYVHIKGLQIKNVKQVPSSLGVQADICVGLYCYDSDHVTLENMDIGVVDGYAYRIIRARHVEVINCDAHDCCDYYHETLPGNWGGGFGGGNGEFSDGYLLYYGCRAWMCSDQGFCASGSISLTVFEKCWAFDNGKMEGGGIGFKLGYWAIPTNIEPVVVMKNCISANNLGDGITGNENTSTYAGPYNLFNNLSYNDGRHGFAIRATISTDANEYKRILKNNISYKYGTSGFGFACYANPGSVYSHSNNTWDITRIVTDEDFVSLDHSQLKLARKADGNLPDISFGKLALTSDLIDAGLDVGLPFNGAAPDLGWVETSSASNPAAPLYVSSVIENATPVRLEMTYNLSLASVTPAASSFVVRVNSTARTVSSVAVSGTKVLLTLASPVVYGDVVTVVYTKPASSPIQTSAGGQAVSITAQSVTNNVGAINPVYVSSVIENATPTRLEMTYNLSLATVTPAASAFSVRVNSTARTVSSVAVSGTKVLLTLASPVVYGDVVTVAYTKPVSSPIQTSAGGQAVSITAQSVTNNVGAINPVYVSSVIENATPTRLEMTYNLSLATVTPAASAFAVRVNSTAKTVSSVAVSGTKVLLTLASPVVYGDVVTVAYIKPASSPIQTSAGGQAVSISAQSVTNNCSSPSNLPPVISISSPVKNTAFVSPATITIEAVASDPDGSVFSVAFYNGNSKLSEIYALPYSFTWKDVTEGTYAVTAVARDNNNATTVSAIVNVVVEKSVATINQIPVVIITAPANNKKLKRHDNIVIEAEASDPDGSISKVEFKSEGITLAVITSPPYRYVWENADTGTYMITAIATDNLGTASASSNVEFTVSPLADDNSEIFNLFPNPNNGYFTIKLNSDVPKQNKGITIIGSGGGVVFSDSLAENESSKEVDLSDLASGTYIVVLFNEQKTVGTKKFIKY